MIHQIFERQVKDKNRLEVNRRTIMQMRCDSCSVSSGRHHRRRRHSTGWAKK